jgi:hypothetical protein
LDEAEYVWAAVGSKADKIVDVPNNSGEVMYTQLEEYRELEVKTLAAFVRGSN